MEKNNAGFRLHRIAASAAQNHPRKSTLSVWASTFRLPDTLGEAEQARRVSKLLLKADAELEHIVSTLRRIPDFDIEFHRTHIHRVAQALQPSLLRVPWAEVGPAFLKPETIVTLWWFGDKLGTDEPEIPAESLANIEQMLAELDEIADDPELPHAFARRLHRVIAAMREAVWEVPIAGTGPLRQAVSSQLVNLSIDAEKVQSEIGDADASKVREVCSKLGRVFAAAAAAAGGMNELIEFWENTAPVREPVMEYLRLGFGS